MQEQACDWQLATWLAEQRLRSAQDTDLRQHSRSRLEQTVDAIAGDGENQGHEHTPDAAGEAAGGYSRHVQGGWRIPLDVLATCRPAGGALQQPPQPGPPATEPSCANARLTRITHGVTRFWGGERIAAHTTASHAAWGWSCPLRVGTTAPPPTMS